MRPRWFRGRASNHRNRMFEDWSGGSAPSAAHPVRLHFCPDARRSAFTLTDHGDRSREQIFRAVYFGHSSREDPRHGKTGVCGRNIKTTQGVFWTGWKGFDYLENPAFLTLMEEAYEAGIEVCPHNTSELFDIPPEETKHNIDRYVDHFGAIETWMDHNFLPTNLSENGLNPRSPFYILPNLQKAGLRAAWSFYDTYLNPPRPALDILRPPTTGEYIRGIATELSNKQRPAPERRRRARSLSAQLFQNTFGTATIYGLGFLRKRNRTKARRLRAFAGLPGDFANHWLATLRGQFRPRFPFWWDDCHKLYWFDTTRFIFISECLTPGSIDDLAKTCGICLAHTYLGVDQPTMRDRAFIEDGNGYRVSDAMDAFLVALEKAISDGTIWNPTLAEMSAYYDALGHVSLVLEGQTATLRNEGESSVSGVTLRTYRLSLASGDARYHVDPHEHSQGWIVLDIPARSSVTLMLRE